MRPGRLNWILAGMAVLLLLFIVYWERDEDKRRERIDRARSALYFDMARVTSLTIETHNLVLQCQREGRRWRLVQPLNTRADPVMVERLLNALQELPRSEIILPTRTALNPLTPYGLDEPRATIQIGEGPRTNTIYIGRRAPLGDGIYIRQTGHQGIVRTSTTLLDLIPDNPTSLRDRTLLSGDTAGVQRLDIRGSSGYIQFTRDELGRWNMRQPIYATADPAPIAELLDSLFASRIRLYVQDHVHDLSAYGLDSPSAITVMLTGDVQDATQILTLGDSLPNNPDLVYARLQAENSVYAVPSSLKNALQLRPGDLLDHRLPGFVPDDLNRLSIRDGEMEIEFQRTPDRQWRLTVPDKADVDMEIFLHFVQSIANLRIQHFQDASPAASTPVRGSRASQTPRILQYATYSSQKPLATTHWVDHVISIRPDPDHPENTIVQMDQTPAWGVIAGRVLLDIPVRPLEYQSRQILSISPNHLLGLQIQVSGRDPFLFLRDPKDPLAPLIPARSAETMNLPETMTMLENTLLNLKAERLLEESVSDEGAYGLNSPYATFSMNLSGESAHFLILLIGDPVPDSTSRYAMIRGRPLLFSLSEDTLRRLTLE